MFCHLFLCLKSFILSSRPLFEGDNEFCLCLKESFPNLKTRKLTRVEWGTIRRLMGKPRRYAAIFMPVHNFFYSSCLSLFFLRYFVVCESIFCLFIKTQFSQELVCRDEGQCSYGTMLCCPGVHQRFLLKSGQHWDRRGRRCACCNKENCLMCRPAKTFLMKSLSHSS